MWKHEAHSFTTWLVDNIDVLGQSIGIDFVSAEREQAAGTFSADIVAEDVAGNTIVIENQFGKSNHDHLGKVITYLTSFEASAAIWLVEQARPEHINAVAWLNQGTNASIYLVKIEAIRIDDSPPAPLFTLIIGPSAEAKEVGKGKRELKERHDLRYQFWTELLQQASKRTRLHANSSAGTTSWISAASGVPGLYLNYGATMHGTKVELSIDRGDADKNLQILDSFLSHRHDVESALGLPVSWEPMEGRRGCRIAVYFDDGGYRSERDEWPRLIDRLIESTILFEKVLRPYLNHLR